MSKVERLLYMSFGDLGYDYEYYHECFDIDSYLNFVDSYLNFGVYIVKDLTEIIHENLGLCEKRIYDIVYKNFVAIEKASGDSKVTDQETYEEIARRALLNPEKKDQVNHPAHYNASKIEVIEILDSVLTSQPDLSPYQGYLLGNVIKYLSRLTLKENPLQDANKAKWYLERLIEGLD